MMRLYSEIPEIIVEIGIVSMSNFRNQQPVEIPTFSTASAKGEDVEILFLSALLL